MNYKNKEFYCEETFRDVVRIITDDYFDEFWEETFNDKKLLIPCQNEKGWFDSDSIPICIRILMTKNINKVESYFMISNHIGSRKESLEFLFPDYEAIPWYEILDAISNCKAVHYGESPFGSFTFASNKRKVNE